MNVSSRPAVSPADAERFQQAADEIAAQAPALGPGQRATLGALFGGTSAICRTPEEIAAAAQRDGTSDQPTPELASQLAAQLAPAFRTHKGAA